MWEGLKLLFYFFGVHDSEPHKRILRACVLRGTYARPRERVSKENVYFKCGIAAATQVAGVRWKSLCKTCNCFQWLSEIVGFDKSHCSLMRLWFHFALQVYTICESLPRRDDYLNDVSNVCWGCEL